MRDRRFKAGFSKRGICLAGKASEQFSPNRIGGQTYYLLANDHHMEYLPGSRSRHT